MENMMADYSAVANVISAFALRNVSMSAQKTTSHNSFANYLLLFTEGLLDFASLTVHAINYGC